MISRWVKIVGITTILLVVVLLLSGFLYQFIGTKIDDYKYPPPGKMVDVGGYQLHIHCTGAGGPIVVLEAGIASSSLDWSLVQPEISKFTRVCSYDRAGMGWSQESPNPRTSTHIVEELHTLLKNANLPGPYILVGHSFGGINVRLYASQYPDEVFGLVLVDSSHELQNKKFPPHPESTVLEKFTDDLANFLVPFGYGRIRAKREQEYLQPFPEDIRKMYVAKIGTTKFFKAWHQEILNVDVSSQELENANSFLGNKPLIVITAGKPVELGTEFEKQHADLLKKVFEISNTLQKDLITKSTKGKQMIAEKSDHLIPWYQPEIIVDAVREEVNEYNSTEKLQKTVDQFDAYVEEQRKAWQVPGIAIGIIKDNKVILSKGYGQRGLKDTRPVDENTVFQIGSLSKAFTAALVALEEQNGKLKWEDKVIDHLPSFRLDDPWVTREFEIVDLLCHRSGLPPRVGLSQCLLGYSQDDMFNTLPDFKPVSSFRSEFAYQNIFFLVAASIIEKNNRMNYSDLLKKEILDPLGMKNTTSSVEDYLKSSNRAEWVRRLKNGENFTIPDDYKERDWTDRLRPAGGINSNINDMIKWIGLHANQGLFDGKQFISIKNMQRLTRAMIFVENTDGYDDYNALGWARREYSPSPIFWHNGSTFGAYAFAAFAPQEKLGIVILSNLRGLELASALGFQFIDSYFDKTNQNWIQKLVPETQEKPNIKLSNPYPSLLLTDYEGVYGNPIYGKVIVARKDTDLELTIGKNKLKLILKHWDRDIFALEWPIVDDSQSKVIFIPDEKGKISKMKIEYFSKEGSGDFEKSP